MKEWKGIRNMKKLQNNFTTPEQSKRMLELGVPADSADCYFFKDGNKYDGVPRPFFLFPRTYEYVEEFNAAYGDKIFPCWSVGRLIEIYYKVYIKPADPLQKWMNIEMGLYGLVEQMMMRFEHDRNKLDFSKLED